MKERRFIKIIYTFLAVLTFISISVPTQAFATNEFPQKNVWYQAIPSVVWNNDPTTLEVHIVGRKDVKRVWITDLGSSEPEGQKELFDDGTHGDKAPHDNVFTLSDVILPGYVSDTGYDNWWGFLRVELENGTRLINNYGMAVGMVDPKYRNAFPVQDFGNGLSATSYAFFIQDSNHQIIDSYPVSDVYCGKANYQAYQRLYSVFPDVFDFVSLMPGMQIFRPSDLAENVPYNVPVSNNIKNIGLSMMDNTDQFGSDGRLQSVIYNSFGTIAIMDHELCHNWGMAIGKELGLLDETWDVELGHWNDMADVQGQMGAYYFGGDSVGHFAYNGDGTWCLLPNYTVEPYSPLELYVMGLIPSSDIPDVHILTNPDFSDPEHITAASYETITAEQIVASAGGERIPSWADSQKEFNMAFVVTQDLPYNDAAYAYFSQISYELMSREPPKSGSSLAPFYWATGGRATLNTYLGEYGVLALPASTLTETPVESPTPQPSETPVPPSSVSPVPPPLETPVTRPPDVTAEPAVVPVQQAGGLFTLTLVVIGVLAAAALVLVIILIIKNKRGK